jgi:hypothetical protein
MKTQLLLPNPLPLRDAWNKSLANAPPGSRIATFPELARARIEAPRPHTPGKPWETYRDGGSPFWQSSFASSTALLVGRIDKVPHLVVVHGFEMPPDPLAGLSQRERRIRLSQSDEKDFKLDEARWQDIVAATPPALRLPFGDGENPAFDASAGHPLDDEACRRHPLLVALFGDALEAYVADHHRLAHEYAFHCLGRGQVLDRYRQEYPRFVAHPPLLRINISWPTGWELPIDGVASGRYATFEPVRQEGTYGCGPYAKSRICDIDACGPGEHIRVAVVTP